MTTFWGFVLCSICNPNLFSECELLSLLHCIFVCHVSVNFVREIFAHVYKLYPIYFTVSLVILHRRFF